MRSFLMAYKEVRYSLLHYLLLVLSISTDYVTSYLRLGYFAVGLIMNFNNESLLCVNYSAVVTMY